VARVLSVLDTLAFVGALAILEFAPGWTGVGVALLIVSVVLGVGLALRGVLARLRAVAMQVREHRRDEGPPA
jgi:hypothetical protein